MSVSFVCLFVGHRQGAATCCLCLPPCLCTSFMYRCVFVPLFVLLLIFIVALAVQPCDHPPTRAHLISRIIAYISFTTLQWPIFVALARVPARDVWGGPRWMYCSPPPQNPPWMNWMGGRVTCPRAQCAVHHNFIDADFHEFYLACCWTVKGRLFFFGGNVLILGCCWW